RWHWCGRVSGRKGGEAAGPATQGAGVAECVRRVRRWERGRGSGLVWAIGGGPVGKRARRPLGGDPPDGTTCPLREPHVPVGPGGDAPRLDVSPQGVLGHGARL